MTKKKFKPACMICGRPVKRRQNGEVIPCLPCHMMANFQMLVLHESRLPASEREKVAKVRIEHYKFICRGVHPSINTWMVKQK